MTVLVQMLILANSGVDISGCRW